MFGMSKAQVVAEKPKFERPGMWAMSILSDAQETIARSGTAEARERARRWINKAKFWIDVCERGPEAIEE
jgi:hypothetical protein